MAQQTDNQYGSNQTAIQAQPLVSQQGQMSPPQPSSENYLRDLYSSVPKGIETESFSPDEYVNGLRQHHDTLLKISEKQSEVNKLALQRHPVAAVMSALAPGRFKGVINNLANYPLEKATTELNQLGSQNEALVNHLGKMSAEKFATLKEQHALANDISKAPLTASQTELNQKRSAFLDQEIIKSILSNNNLPTQQKIDSLAKLGSIVKGQKETKIAEKKLEIDQADLQRKGEEFTQKKTVDRSKILSDWEGQRNDAHKEVDAAAARIKGLEGTAFDSQNPKDVAQRQADMGKAQLEYSSAKKNADYMDNFVQTKRSEHMNQTLNELPPNIRAQGEQLANNIIKNPNDSKAGAAYDAWQKSVLSGDYTPKESKTQPSSQLNPITPAERTEGVKETSHGKLPGGYTLQPPPAAVQLSGPQAMQAGGTPPAPPGMQWQLVPANNNGAISPANAQPGQPAPPAVAAGAPAATTQGQQTPDGLQQMIQMLAAQIGEQIKQQGVLQDALGGAVGGQ